MPRMRPAIEVGSWSHCEAADPYMGLVLGVSKAAAACRNFGESVRDREGSARRADEKGTYRAYRAFRALLFGNRDSLVSRNQRSDRECVRDRGRIGTPGR